jgi:hypothetical protein
MEIFETCQEKLSENFCGVTSKWGQMADDLEIRLSHFSFSSYFKKEN